MKITIRRFSPQDRKAASDVIVRCLREVNSRDYTEAQIARLCRAFAPAEVEARFRERMSFVAVQDKAIVGTATLRGDEVGSVFVRPDLHGRGVGRALVEQMEAQARANGLSALKAYSSLYAVAFYLRLGFGRLYEKHEPDGEVAVLMEKPL